MLKTLNETCFPCPEIFRELVSKDGNNAVQYTCEATGSKISKLIKLDTYSNIPVGGSIEHTNAPEDCPYLGIY
jgi:hypothetical protein